MGSSTGTEDGPGTVAPAREGRAVTSGSGDRGGEPGPDDRAVAPAVGKLLEVGIVVLFVGLVTTVLLGGVVPGYRTAVGGEVSERVLATATHGVERAVPSTTTAREVRATREVTLPPAVRDSGYALRVDGRDLVLDHPHPDVGGRMRLSMPPSVTRVRGSWDSGARTLVRVRGDSDGLVVELVEGERP